MDFETVSGSKPLIRARDQRAEVISRATTALLSRDYRGKTAGEALFSLLMSKCQNPESFFEIQTIKIDEEGRRRGRRGRREDGD